MAFYSEASDSLSGSPRTNQCIVLDLDETLVHASDDMVRFHRLKIATDPQLMDIRDRSYAISLDDVIERRGTGTKTQLWAITRPYLKEFLIFCFNHFKIVAVWSAGRYKYVHATVEAIFKDIAMPHIIYTWDDCDKSGKGIFKPLEQMIANEPGMDQYMSLTNTFAIDDRPSTYSKNPYNGIRIPEYKPHFTVEGMRIKDNALLQLMNWFKQPYMMTSTDVRTLDKTNIFNQPLAANPSNVPVITSDSVVSKQLNDIPMSQPTPQVQHNGMWSPSMFLPNSCIGTDGSVICDPRLKPVNLLDEPSEIKRTIDPVGSPMVAFSPLRSPRMTGDIATPSLSPINLKLPMSPSPAYLVDYDNEPTQLGLRTETPGSIPKPPDSPTFRPDPPYSNGYSVRVPTYYGSQRDITGSQYYVRVPS